LRQHVARKEEGGERERRRIITVPSLPASFLRKKKEGGRAVPMWGAEGKGEKKKDPLGIFLIEDPSHGNVGSSPPK